MHIKLRRTEVNGDGWGAYCEEIGLYDNDALAYRVSTGGNCEIGDWNEWQGESEALAFLLGPIPRSNKLIGALRQALASLPDLVEIPAGTGDMHTESNF